MAVNQINKKVQRLNQMLARASAARGSFFQKCKRDQEKYFNDVDGTGTNFTQEQLTEVTNSYAIPVNTKIAYPIVEQITSFLTSTKPYPRLLSTTENTSDFTTSYADAYHGVWYESKGNKQLKYAIRDMLTAGRGYLRVRKNNFFDESTFGCVIEHIPWQRIYIDPECKRDDLSDAEYVVICHVLRRSRAEKEYDIKISPNLGSDRSSITGSGLNSDDLGIVVQDWLVDNANGANERDQYVLIKEYYERRDLNVFITENGQISTRRPIPFVKRNEEKIALKAEIENLTAEIKQLAMNVSESSLQQDELMDQELMNSVDQQKQIEQQLQEKQQLLNELMQSYAEMPSKLQMFKLKMENGEIIEAKEISKIKKKKVEWSLMVGDTIIDEEWLNIGKYPLIQFPFDWKDAVKCYSLIHRIDDLVMAMDKYISLMMLSIATDGSRKVLYAEGSIVEPDDIENKWPVPGSWIEYKSDMNLPDGGKPYVVEPSGINQNLVYFVDKFLQLIEYVTGIYGVVQGNGNEAPTTFSATQSMQSFGTQRVKQYSRTLESALEDLAYIVVSYLQMYAPKDKVLAYFNDEDEPVNITLMEDTRDIMFKVRVDVSSSLPTTRQWGAQMLANIAQTAGDQRLASLLTQYTLELIDLPQGKKWAKQLDIIQNMQQEIDSLKEELKTGEGRQRALENNLIQKESAHRIDMEAERAKGDIKAEKAAKIAGIQTEGEPETEENTMLDPEDIMNQTIPIEE